MQLLGSDRAAALLSSLRGARISAIPSTAAQQQQAAALNMSSKTFAGLALVAMVLAMGEHSMRGWCWRGAGG